MTDASHPAAPPPALQPAAAQPAAALRISVVIAHLNQPALLARCLAALAAGTRAPDEVIVVDNGSREPPAALCAAHGARLMHEAVPGPGPARSTGAAAAAGDVLAFTDADCLPDPGWLAAAAAAMADPAAQILGGDVRIALADPDPARMTAIEAYESVYAYRMDIYIARKGFTGTGNLVVRRGTFAAVGPFAGLGTAEDIDWGRRAVGKGYRIRYVPDMRVYHPARRSFPELCMKWDRHIAHGFAAARGGAGRARWIAKTLAIGLSPLAEILRLATTDRLPDARARRLAFGVLVRIRLYRARQMAWLLLGGDPAVLAGRWNRV